MKHLLPAILLLFSTALCAQVTDLDDLTTPRSGHEMVQLPNGQVLAAGGWTGESYTSSAEVYNGETWNAVDPMANQRYSFNLVIAGGEALAIGGWDGDALNHASTERFNAEFMVWEEGPTLTSGRSNCRSIVLNSGLVLVTGGFDGNSDLTSCELIDPSDWTVTATGDMNNARSSHALVLLNDGRVLAMGGFNPTLGFQMDACEIYDPATGQWSAAASLDTGRDNHTAVALPNGQVTCMGGRSFNAADNWFEGLTSTEIYNPDSDTWEAGGALTEGSSFNQAYFRDAEDDVLLIAGTNVSGNNVTTTYGTNQRNTYGPDTWVDGAEIATADRFRQASCALASGGILLSGGDADGTVQLIGLYDTVEALEPTALLAFPNPTHGNVTVPQTTETNSLWMTVSGKQVFPSYSHRGQWSVESLAPGMYYVQPAKGYSFPVRAVSVR